jgi:uncharacterized DUF497 family protein
VTVTFDYDNLAKHNVNCGEIDEVLDCERRVEIEMQPSNRGNQRVMLVGFTSQARLLEVGIEFLPDSDHVFPASDATKRFRFKFEQNVKP